MARRRDATDSPEGSSVRSMDSRDFQRFSEFIHSECGIKLPPAKKTMLEARLQKRLRNLGMTDYKEYCDYLFSLRGMEIELPHLIDVVTTNTTDFFREPKHFDILFESVLPAWFRRHGSRRELVLWSAGCSTGEEPYTLAMVLSEFAAVNPEFTFSILATDISNQVLERAVKAVYAEERVEAVPMALKRKYLMRSKDRSRGLVRVTPELRRLVRFRRLNFMESFGFRECMDVIFCRNVLIYFDRPTQERLLSRFCAHLEEGGHIFIGHSESLTGMDLPLTQIAPTVYRRI